MSPSSRISYGVAHAEGPVDGSLYATVHKRQHEFVEHSNILQNGNTQLQNGSQASSVDPMQINKHRFFLYKSDIFLFFFQGKQKVI
jgi:hypothetical protein